MHFDDIMQIYPPSAQARSIHPRPRYFKPWNGEEVPDRMLADINAKSETLIRIPNGHRLTRDDLHRVRYVPPPGNYPVEWEGDRPVSAFGQEEPLRVG